MSKKFWLFFLFSFVLFLWWCVNMPQDEEIINNSVNENVVIKDLSDWEYEYTWENDDVLQENDDVFEEDQNNEENDEELNNSDVDVIFEVVENN